jgi:hypothetical protein
MGPRDVTGKHIVKKNATAVYEQKMYNSDLYKCLSTTSFHHSCNLQKKTEKKKKNLWVEIITYFPLI